jgi:PIN domain nuclease of toxin-antitoxin system
MKLLLDTHALLWWATSNPNLPAKVHDAIASDATEVIVSAATAWEIATKVRIGKLVWHAEAGSVHAYALSQGFAALPISLQHAERAGSLPVAHRDPFDRMLMAQAILEDLWLASNESIFETVGVRRYW